MNKEFCQWWITSFGLNAVHVAYLAHKAYVKENTPMQRETNLNKELQHWSSTFGYFFLCVQSHACVLQKKRNGEKIQHN